MTIMKGAEREILDRRDARETKILVTGASGFLGSHLMVEFLRRGYPVIALCRSKEGVSGTERIGRLLKWFGMSQEEAKRLEVVEAFLDRPHLGLEEETYAFLMGQIDEIFHCAGDTSFAEKNRASVENANLKGLGFLLDLALAGRCRFFHYVSTAYAAGRREGHCPETHTETREFTNVYEETKHRAEKLVLEACKKGGMHCNIYRPSIVYGDSVTGKTLRFNALYYPVRTAQYFKELYLKDLLKKEGENAKKMGVRMEEDGSLYLPIRIAKEGYGRLNVIPVDFFVKACLAIMEESLSGDVFHIVSNHPNTLDELVDYTERFLNISGIRTVERHEFQKTQKNAFDLLVAGYIDIYEPYMRDRRIFISQKADGILEKRGIHCPSFNYDTFKRCMTYALDVEWGKRLYREGVLVR
jgi:nucleoside-diphosphate-sugar epimerase